MGLSEFLQTFQPGFSSREIESTQSARHPDVDRKGLAEAEAEQQDTIGDFAADPRQFHQLQSSFLDRHLADGLQIRNSGSNPPGCL